MGNPGPAEIAAQSILQKKRPNTALDVVEDQKPVQTATALKSKLTGAHPMKNVQLAAAQEKYHTNLHPGMTKCHPFFLHFLLIPLILKLSTYTSVTGFEKRF